MHLRALLRPDEVVSVRVPTTEQEDARDLMRAREDVRGDLIRGRPRLSKLLVRRGIVYSWVRPGPGPPTCGYGKSPINRVHNVKGKNC